MTLWGTAMNGFLRISRLRDIGFAAGVFLLSSLGVASATTYNQFSLDLGASSVTIGQSACWPGCAVSPGINTSAATSGTSLDFGFDSLSQSLNIPDLIDWAISGTGLGAFTMSLNLAFTAPDPQTGTASGVGQIGTFWGVLTEGYINWTNPIAPITFANGSELSVTLDQGVYVASDPYNWGGPGVIQTGMTIAPTVLAGLTTPSPVPLPAALPVLLAMGLGGLGLGWGRRRSISPSTLPA